MKRVTSFALLGLLAFALGCQDSKTSPAIGTATSETSQKSALDKLSPEDRKLADAQRMCAIENKNALGSMDVPIKIMIKDQPVFLCCKACEKRWLAKPDETLKKVEELKSQTGK